MFDKPRARPSRLRAAGRFCLDCLSEFGLAMLPMHGITWPLPPERHPASSDLRGALDGPDPLFEDR